MDNYIILSHFQVQIFFGDLKKNQSVSHVTLQKEDNYGGAYAGLIYSQFWMKGFISLLFRT